MEVTEPELERKTEILRQPIAEELFVHSILRTKDIQATTSSIGETRVIRSRKLSSEPCIRFEDPKSTILDYQIQCNHITPVKSRIFTFNQFAFLFSPESLWENKALIYDEGRGDYPGIVTVYDALKEQIGGAQIPIQDTILLVNASIHADQLHRVVSDLGLTDDPKWPSRVFLWQKNSELTSMLQTVARDRSKIEIFIEEQWRNWLFDSLIIFEIDKLNTEIKDSQEILIPSLMAITEQRQRLELGKAISLVSQNQEEEITEKLDLSKIIRKSLDSEGYYFDEVTNLLIADGKLYQADGRPEITRETDATTDFKSFTDLRTIRFKQHGKEKAISIDLSYY